MGDREGAERGAVLYDGGGGTLQREREVRSAHPPKLLLPSRTEWSQWSLEWDVCGLREVADSKERYYLYENPEHTIQNYI